MGDDLGREVVRLLNSLTDASAAEIARRVGVPRATVNSHLYSGLGTRYELSGDSPPLWRLLVRGKSGPVRHPIPQVLAAEPVHVDFAGGDWELRVAVRHSSRNDPIAVIEHLGPRSRAILVADYVSTSGPDSTVLDTAVLAVAASMLAWEISLDLAQRHPGDHFDFARATRDVYRSLLAHARRRLTSA